MSRAFLFYRNSHSMKIGFSSLLLPFLSATVAASAGSLAYSLCRAGRNKMWLTIFATIILSVILLLDAFLLVLTFFKMVRSSLESGPMAPFGWDALRIFAINAAVLFWLSAGTFLHTRSLATKDERGFLVMTTTTTLALLLAVPGIFVWRIMAGVVTTPPAGYGDAFITCLPFYAGALLLSPILSPLFFWLAQNTLHRSPLGRD